MIKSKSYLATARIHNLCITRCNQKIFKNPDEVRKFSKGKLELANLGDSTIGRYTAEPGWKWSKDIKPIVNTNSCQITHTEYVISGRVKVKMDDGTEQEFGPGEALYIPPGHDAWVVGNESLVAIDFSGAKEYATSKT